MKSSSEVVSAERDLSLSLPKLQSRRQFRTKNKSVISQLIIGHYQRLLTEVESSVQHKRIITGPVHHQTAFSYKQ